MLHDIFKGLVAVNNAVYRVCKVLIMLFLSFLTLLVFAGIVARFTQKSIAWTEGPIIYFFSWLTYIGAAVVLHDKGHIGVTVFLDRIKIPAVRKGLVVLGQLAILVMAFTVIIFSSRMIQVFYRNDLRDHTIQWLKMAYVFLQVPISNALFVLFILEQILEGLLVTHEKTADAEGNYDVGDATAKG